MLIRHTARFQLAGPSHFPYPVLCGRSGGVAHLAQELLGETKTQKNNFQGGNLRARKLTPPFEMIEQSSRVPGRFHIRSATEASRFCAQVFIFAGKALGDGGGCGKTFHNG